MAHSQQPFSPPCSASRARTQLDTPRRVVYGSPDACYLRPKLTKGEITDAMRTEDPTSKAWGASAYASCSRLSRLLNLPQQRTCRQHLVRMKMQRLADKHTYLSFRSTDLLAALRLRASYRFILARLFSPIVLRGSGAFRYSRTERTPTTKSVFSYSVVERQMPANRQV
jgi:hypothetical protein